MGHLSNGGIIFTFNIGLKYMDMVTMSYFLLHVQYFLNGSEIFLQEQVKTFSIRLYETESHGKFSHPTTVAD